jgi:WD40 repeat protein
MAPEQAEARHDLVGERTDVYGLGAILFEILTGHPPHEGQTTDEVLKRIATGASPRARSVNPEVPKALDAVCARAMAHSPDDRYPSATELAEDVQRWLADEPVTAWPENLCQRAARWLRSHRATLTAVVALAVTGVSLMITVLATVAYRGTLETSNLRDKALKQEQSISEERERFRLYNEARAERSERTPGWTESAVSKLASVARHAPPPRFQKAIRDEVVAGLVSLDADPEKLIPVDMPFAGSAFEFAISPDSRSVAVIVKRPMVRFTYTGALYDLGEGKKVRSFRFEAKQRPARSFMDGNFETVNDVGFSPDGRWLAAGTSNGQVHVWDLRLPSERPFTWDAHKGPVLGLEFSRDSQALFSSAKAPDNALRRWPLPMPEGFRPEQAREFKAADWLSPPVLAADGATLLVSTEKGLHRLDPLNLTGSVVPGFPFKEFAVSPDGLSLAGRDSRILLYPLRGGTVRDMAEPFGMAHRTDFRLHYNAGGSLLVTSCPGGGNRGRGRNIKIWDLASHRHAVTIPVAGRGEFDAQFTPDGRHVVFVANQQIRVRKVHGYEVMTIEARTSSPLSSASWSPDGRAVVGFAGEPVGGPTGYHLEAAYWDLADPRKRETRTIDLPEGPDDATDYCGLSCHPAGNVVALTSDGKLHLWDRSRTGADAWRVVALPKGRAMPAFSRDGSKLWGLLTATGADDQVFTLSPDGQGFETIYRDPTSTKVLLSGQAGLSCLGTSGDRLLVGGSAEYLLFDESDPKRPPRSWPMGRQQVRSVASSGDGRWLAVGTGTGDVFLRRVSDDVAFELSEPYLGRVGALALSRDGRLMASGSDDSTIRLHVNDGGTLHEVLRLPPQSYEVAGLAFSPDETKLLIWVEKEYAIRVLHLDRLKDRLHKMGLDW